MSCFPLSLTFSETIRNIERQRPLTQAEQTEVQRQRKKVRNREYAQNCRSKKKQILESAQDENDRLKQEKTEIHNALIETQKDNQRLLYENMHMKMILSVCPSFRSLTNCSLESRLHFQLDNDVASCFPTNGTIQSELVSHNTECNLKARIASGIRIALSGPWHDYHQSWCGRPSFVLSRKL